MSLAGRALDGLVVGLSVSESDQSARLGFPEWQVNRVTLQVVAALIGQGAAVMFGHDWRDDGVMEAIHGFALQIQPTDVPSGLSDEASSPLLMNLLPWPDAPKLHEEERARLRSTLRVEQAGLPLELRPYDNEYKSAPPNTKEYRYLRARALTHLRHELNKRCDARICLGGRVRGYKGRYPGVIEEALLSLQSERPLFLAGALGGATRQVIDAVEGRPMPRDFCAASVVRELYADPPPALRESHAATQADRTDDPSLAWNSFERAGTGSLARQNELSKDENLELFNTPVVDRVIQLMLIGLSRIRSQG